MPTYREDLHLGHKVPLVETDDISDKAITSKKMADNSVIWDKLGNDVKTRINAMSSVNLSISPNVIMKDLQSEVYVEALAYYDNDEIRIKRNGIDIAVGSGKTLAITDTITPTGTEDIVYTAEFIKGDDVKAVDKTLPVAQPIYYGAGQTIEDATNVASPRTSVNGEYHIAVTADGSYLFFIVPNSMTINRVTMNSFEVGFDEPTTEIIPGYPYKVYKSSDAYNQFDEILIVS